MEDIFLKTYDKNNSLNSANVHNPGIFDTNHINNVIISNKEYNGDLQGKEYIF